jgi:ubiquinone/menaquinone biosynthesis C-methylase UbiE
VSQNIKYTSREIEEFYKSNRIRWDQFYESEKKVISKIGIDTNSKILDLGCGCGGLGLALKEKYGSTNYTGVEINTLASETAKIVYPDAIFINKDILALSEEIVQQNMFDVVFSLSCVDWNIQFDEMLLKGFSYVKPGGYLVSSFRLTNLESLTDVTKSYQYINFKKEKEGEIAPYIVNNIHELLKTLKKLSPQEIYSYGYWGKPSETAILPYTELCFAVFAVKKAMNFVKDPLIDLDLPKDILESLKNN